MLVVHFSILWAFQSKSSNLKIYQDSIMKERHLRIITKNQPILSLELMKHKFSSQKVQTIDIDRKADGEFTFLVLMEFH